MAPVPCSIKQETSYNPLSHSFPTPPLSGQAASIPLKSNPEPSLHLTPPKSPQRIIPRPQPGPPAKMQRRDREPSESLSVPLACVVCRERHVKCDGRQPACSRCLDSKQNCFYVQSRRGRRPSRKRDRSQESSDSASTSRRRSSTLTVPGDMEVTAFTAAQRSPMYAQAMTSVPSPQPSLQASPAFHRSMSMSPNPSIQRIPGPPSVSHGGQNPNLLQELYYFYFHDSHPILVPQAYLPHITHAMPTSVQAAMHYVGSQYSNVAKNDPIYLQRLRESLFSPGADRNRFTVQALLLLGVAQRGQDRNDLALDTFNQAIDLAVQLGMNRASFAQENSEGSVIIQEMWRRVWWELYINDAILAEVRQSSYFRMCSIECDVGLPWEEMEYRNCNPGISHSIRDLDNVMFGEEETVLSSFAYRINAARIIATLLKLNQSYCPNSEEIMASLDLAVSNWQLHLPDRKKSPIERDGSIDEMMFHAHLMVNSTTVCLHRPLSNLIFTSIQDASTVTPSQRGAPPAAKHATHTAKAIQAADRISNLMTLPGDTIRHSPLFTCAVTLGAVVHLSAYVLSDDLNRSALIRDRIALSTGALKGLRYTWPLAMGVLQHLKVAAKEVMTYGQQQAGASSVLGSTVAYDTRGMAPDPWMAAMQDPLFTEIPDLMPEDAVAVTMGMAMPSVPYTQ